MSFQARDGALPSDEHGTSNTGGSLSAQLAEMQRRGLRIGDPLNLKLGYALLSIWGGVGIVTIVAAAVALPTA